MQHAFNKECPYGSALDFDNEESFIDRAFVLESSVASIFHAGGIDLPAAAHAFVERLASPPPDATTSVSRVEYVRMREIQSTLQSWDQFGHSWTLIRVRDPPLWCPFVINAWSWSGCFFFSCCDSLLTPSLRILHCSSGLLCSNF